MRGKIALWVFRGSRETISERNYINEAPNLSLSLSLFLSSPTLHSSLKTPTHTLPPFSQLYTKYIRVGGGGTAPPLPQNIPILNSTFPCSKVINKNPQSRLRWNGMAFM